LLYCELTSGVLMGLQDAEKFVGSELKLVSSSGDEGRVESTRGGWTPREGEPILIDGEGPVASVVRGPAERVAIEDSSTYAMFIVFSCPDVTGSDFAQGVSTAENLLRDAGAEPMTSIADGAN